MTLVFLTTVFGSRIAKLIILPRPPYYFLYTSLILCIGHMLCGTLARQLNADDRDELLARLTSATADAAPATTIGHLAPLRHGCICGVIPM
jgi:hypothetical protein